MYWDYGYFGHQQGNKICPNYDPSKRISPGRNKTNKKDEQVNATAGEESSHGGTGGRTSQMSATSSLTNGTGWATLAAAAAKSKLVSFNLADPSSANATAGNLKDESVTCTLAGTKVAHDFTFQRTTPCWDPDHHILLDNQSMCHVFKDKSLITNIQSVPHPIAIGSTAGTSYDDMVGYIGNFPDPICFILCKSLWGRVHDHLQPG